MMTIKTTAQKVVVAGATGYLGRHLVREFVDRGAHVTAIVRPGKTVPDATACVEAQVTDPASLRGVCDGADAVFSALGITRQTDSVTYEDIEYTANMNLLAEAQRAGVGRFGVISVVHPEVFEGLAITTSRERFVRHLQAADITSSVVRATGFFSDLQEVFEMAATGRVYVVGTGETRVNPVHGADLARACADALTHGHRDVNVGGPDVLTWDAIAELAFEALSAPPKITHVPAWIPRSLLPLVKPFSRRKYDVGSFIVRGATHDMVAPPHGRHHLEHFYQDLARAHSS